MHILNKEKVVFFENEELHTLCAIRDNHEVWLSFVAELRRSNVQVVALRGAGSVNGIDPLESTRLLILELIPRLITLGNIGPLVIAYDGDEDNLNKPDIGYIMGRLVGYFASTDLPVMGLAVQKESWYYPSTPDANLESASGVQYTTFVFPDGKYEGDHNAFSQGAELVALEGYQQWYVGASGLIAQSQLLDYNEKVPVGKTRRATLFRARINSALTEEIQAKLDQARTDKDAAKIQRFEAQLQQRKQVYGVHWDNEGLPTLDATDLPNLELIFVP